MLEGRVGRWHSNREVLLELGRGALRGGGRLWPLMSSTHRALSEKGYTAGREGQGKVVGGE